MKITNPYLQRHQMFPTSSNSFIAIFHASLELPWKQRWITRSSRWKSAWENSYPILSSILWVVPFFSTMLRLTIIARSKPWTILVMFRLLCLVYVARRRKRSIPIFRGDRVCKMICRDVVQQGKWKSCPVFLSSWESLCMIFKQRRTFFSSYISRQPWSCFFTYLFLLLYSW